MLWSQHQLVSKQSGQTSDVEKFNCNLKTKICKACKENTFIF
ncbi:hypothetical protein PRO82_002256 [Candidatus Protochlamydia amoebophila]|nr:hypothetical protein [Candidatus Protochlamydia amoebophila]